MRARILATAAAHHDDDDDSPPRAPLPAPLRAQPKVNNFINGVFSPSATDTWIPVHDPATNKLLCMLLMVMRVPLVR